MMCAVSLPVTLSLYRSLPTLSIIHVYYSCRISPLDCADQRLWGNVSSIEVIPLRANESTKIGIQFNAIKGVGSSAIL